ncbi:MAG: DUF4189 domain-containing protein [Alphaproteobacteria bacterium]|jgi:hypothetical protein|nr:DUF4189 domain-containing protein [Alphaproteobacteria bacterium]
MLRYRAFLAALSLLALCGFSVEGPRGGSGDAITRLENSPRWSAGKASLASSGERGLGGGLEYAVDSSLCELEFVDGSDCSDIRRVLSGALGQWAAGHPALAFTDVTGRITPAFPLAATGERGQGAEIDFFAAGPKRFPPFRARQVTGYTIFYERRSGGLEMTNGTRRRGVARIESADVRFNASRCYYIALEAARAHCLHFPSVALHEIGHALGIAHPDDAPQYNLDSDDRPGNPIAIDCRNPARGLSVSLNLDGAAAAIGRNVQGAGRWIRGLTWDDQAARDALYPHCAIEKVERWSGAWGAFAVSQADGVAGRASLRETPAAAEATARQACRDAGGEACRLVASFEGCFAYASGQAGIVATAEAARDDAARVDAVLACGEAGGRDCRISADFCAFEPLTGALSP